MNEHVVLPWFFVAAGAFTLTAAAMDWDWFLNQRKARFWVRLLGRTGARVLYGLLGLAFVLGGGAFGLGVVG